MNTNNSEDLAACLNALSSNELGQATSSENYSAEAKDTLAELVAETGINVVTPLEAVPQERAVPVGIEIRIEEKPEPIKLEKAATLPSSEEKSSSDSIAGAGTVRIPDVELVEASRLLIREKERNTIEVVNRKYQ